MSNTRIEPGTIISAIVSAIEDFGIFLDHDGTSILVLITDMTNGVVDHPSNLVSLGEKIELKILRYNEDKDGYAATMLTGGRDKKGPSAV